VLAAAEAAVVLVAAVAVVAPAEVPAVA